MSRPVLLDTSFLVALERETVRGKVGPARRFLPKLKGRKIVVSVVTVEELLEGSVNENATLLALQRFTIQGIHLAHAQRCAELQRKLSKRMGENDAWLVSTANAIDAEVAGADRVAFERLGAKYLRFR